MSSLQSSVISELPSMIFALVQQAREKCSVFTGVCCVAVTATLLFGAVQVRRSQKKNPGPRMRSTSIGSTTMMVGGLLPPDQAQDYDAIINVLVRFDRLMTLEDLREVFLLNIVPYEKFHSVPMQKNFGPVTWMPQKVDITKHVIGSSVRRPQSSAKLSIRELEQLVRDEAEKHLNTPLSTRCSGRPWWEVHHISVDGTTVGGVLLRIHHALGDGVSLMEAMADVLTDASGKPLDMSKAFSPAPRGARKSFNPLRAFFLVLDAMKSFVSIIAATAVGCDTPCAFQDSSRSLPMKPNRFSVYFPSHSVGLIKQIRTQLEAKGISGVTVNDIEFALFAGAVARFCKKRGDDPAKLSLRAMTPFAVPEKVCPETRYRTLLRNNFTLLLNKLPIAAASAVERVKASHKTWQKIKNSTIVPVSFIVHRINTSLSAGAQRNTFKELMTRHCVVFSNVPGPQQPIFLAGQEISSVHMLYPNVAQQVGILSLNGMIHMAVVMAASADPSDVRRELPDCFLQELQELCTEVGVSRVSMLSQLQM
jgi:diacylglycerol O-acyltransferase